VVRQMLDCRVTPRNRHFTEYEFKRRPRGTSGHKLRAGRFRLAPESRRQPSDRNWGQCLLFTPIVVFRPLVPTSQKSSLDGLAHTDALQQQTRSGQTQGEPWESLKRLKSQHDTALEARPV